VALVSGGVILGQSNLAKGNIVGSPFLEKGHRWYDSKELWCFLQARHCDHCGVSITIRPQFVIECGRRSEGSTEGGCEIILEQNLGQEGVVGLTDQAKF